MSIDISHFIFVPFCDADDQVIDEGLDGTECRDVFSGAMVDFDLDDVFLG